MDAKKKTIIDYFNGQRKLEIPFFQRSYVWPKELLKRFLESMEHITQSNKDYFMGAIISKENPSNNGSQLIIDGQQRLTTLALFLKVLLLKEDNFRVFDRLFFSADVESELCLRHNYYDRECFEKIMKQETLERIDSNSRLAEAYNYFLDNVDTSKFSYEKIKNKLTFVGIELNADEDEQVIFDTINSLGVSLTTGELLKNFVFNRDSIDKYLSKWKPVFEDDEDTISYWNSRTTQGRLSRTNFDNFLYAYLHIKINAPELNLPSGAKLRFRSADNLFGQYKDYFELSHINFNDFVSDLTTYAKLYREYINASILDEEVSREWGIERINVIIFGLDTTTLIPYVLYILKNQSNEAERNEIFRILEAYLMRRLVCKSSNDNYSDLFSSSLINNQILTSDSLFDYLINTIKEDSSLVAPTNLELYKGFQNSILVNQRAKGILYLLESRLASESHATTIRSLNTYSLEHLMPKKWKQEWNLHANYTEEQRNFHLKTLGNLAILPSKLNTSISNKSWTDKKEGNARKGGLKQYAAGLITLQNVIIQPDWNEDKIKERAIWLASEAKDIWFLGDDFTEETELNIESNDSPNESTESNVIQNATARRNARDNSLFSVNGSEFLKKNVFAYKVVKTFIEQHPDYTYQQLKDIFVDDIIRPYGVYKGLLARVEDIRTLAEQEQNRRYHFDQSELCLSSSDGVQFYVSTQWSLQAIEKLIPIVEQYGIHCEKQSR